MAEASASTAALHAATSSPQTPLELAVSVVEAVPGITHGHAAPHGQQSSNQAGAQHAQQQQPKASHVQQRQAAAKVWGGVEYDSNFADIDGTLHVFSDTAMSDEEDDTPPAPKQKYVLLDRVPQVCCYGLVRSTTCTLLAVWEVGCSNEVGPVIVVGGVPANVVGGVPANVVGGVPAIVLGGFLLMW